ncbi:MAG: hypothetical protein RI983_1795 [Bacteroidota bacterium]|jgi:hypothetical protein
MKKVLAFSVAVVCFCSFSFAANSPLSSPKNSSELVKKMGNDKKFIQTIQMVIDFSENLNALKSETKKKLVDKKASEGELKETLTCLKFESAKDFLKFDAVVKRNFRELKADYAEVFNDNLHFKQAVSNSLESKKITTKSFSIKKEDCFLNWLELITSCSSLAAGVQELGGDESTVLSAWVACIDFATLYLVLCENGG